MCVKVGSQHQGIHVMSLATYERPSAVTVAPSQERLFEEGPLVVEYRVHVTSPSRWMASGVVRQGMPPGSGWIPHPQFAGIGVTEVKAIYALRREVRDYLDSPLWEDQPCR
jgi:hypothetical protein